MEHIIFSDVLVTMPFVFVCVHLAWRLVGWGRGIHACARRGIVGVCTCVKERGGVSVCERARKRERRENE